MFALYVDESGDTGIPPFVNTPTIYFGLTGIVVHELN